MESLLCCSVGQPGEFCYSFLCPGFPLLSYYLGLVHHGVRSQSLCGNSTHLQVADVAVASYRHPLAHCNLPPERSCNSTAAGHHARFASDKKARIRPWIVSWKVPLKECSYISALPSEVTKPTPPSRGRCRRLEVLLNMADVSCRETWHPASNFIGLLSLETILNSSSTSAIGP